MDSEQRKINREQWRNPENWGGPKWLCVYFSKRDSRVWVPKRIPWMGWTLNLAKNGGVYWLFLLILFLVLLPIVICIISHGAR